MPRGNKTGPLGMGSMTGRAAGYCAGFGTPGSSNVTPGRGFGPGFGRGYGVSGMGFGGGRRGRRNMLRVTGLPGRIRYGGNGPVYGNPVSYRNPDPQIEKRALKSQAEALQSEIELIQKRLNEIEAGTTAE